MDNPVTLSEANQLFINCTCSIKIQTLPLMTFINKMICTVHLPLCLWVYFSFKQQLKGPVE